MTVYIEYVIFNNFVIDYLLLKFTYLFTGKTVKNFNLFISSFVGAIFSLIFPLIRLGKIYSTIIKLLFGTLLVLITAKYKSKKEFIINLTIFYFLTFLLGGSIIGVYSIIGVSYYKEFTVALCFIPAYLIIYGIKNVVSFIYKRRHVESVIYNFEFTLFGEKYVGRGFLDTGNNLYYKDNPVIVCEKNFIKKALDKKEFYSNVKKISVSTALCEKEKFCIKLDEFKIFIGDKPNIYNNVTLTIAEVNITGADAILHPALLGVNYENDGDAKIKKVS